jgi:hypothetical protein
VNAIGFLNFVYEFDVPCRAQEAVRASCRRGSVTFTLDRPWLTDFDSLSYCESCRLLFTTAHRIPQAIMQVSQAVHERATP